MELGATMELWGKEVGQLWGRRPLYIVGESIQPLPHCTSPHRAVLPLGKGGTTAPPGGTTVESGGQKSDRPERYCRGGWAVLPLMSGTAALVPLRSTALSDTKNDPSSRRGRGLVP